MKWVANGDKGLCVFVVVSAKDLDRIKNDKRWHLNLVEAGEIDLYRDKGKHVVVLMVHCYGERLKFKRMVKDRFKGYDSYSFWNRGHKRFYTRGIK